MCPQGDRAMILGSVAKGWGVDVQWILPPPGPCNLPQGIQGLVSLRWAGVKPGGVFLGAAL